MFWSIFRDLGFDSPEKRFEEEVTVLAEMGAKYKNLTKMWHQLVLARLIQLFFFENFIFFGGRKIGLLR